MMSHRLTRRDVAWKQESGKREPRDRQHDEADWDSDQHPARETDLDIVVLGHEAH
jgi:hypothetical protein